MLNILVDVEINIDKLAELKAIPEVKVHTIEPAVSARQIPADLAELADVLFCTVPPTNLNQMKSLRFIQIASSGYSQLFNLGLNERNITAANAAGVFDTIIAEWNLAMMINLRRDMRQLIRNQDAGIWDRSAIFQREIRGSVVGLWGYGGIARETARIARLIGMTVWALTRTGIKPRQEKFCIPGTGDPDGKLPDEVFLAGQEHEFLCGLDFLIMSMPLTRHSEGLVGEKELRALPSRAFLLNPARGPLIQEPALLRALREGWIAGAALDTHYYYPMPADHPLWRFPNVIMTPHISGSSQSPSFLERIWEVFIENVSRLQNSRPLLNKLTANQLAGE